MLTESERQWLEDRKHKAYCCYCNVSKLCANSFASGYSCPLTSNMKDALEFSERVAVKLAEAYGTMMDHNEKHSLSETTWKIWRQSMNNAKIEACEKLCREFLERAKKVKGDDAALGKDEWYWGSKDTAALRRTSMELTRALADMRRPG